MEEKKGDVRIYIISSLFFLCIIGGGIFLCLYIFLPETESKAWYPIAGMMLTGIPWVFWLLTYLYTCFKISHQHIQVQGHFAKSSKNAAASRTSGATATTAAMEAAVESPGGGRHVRFGTVIVIGSEDGSSDHRSMESQPDEASHGHDAGGGDSQRTIASTSSALNEADHSVSSSESEMPLTSAVLS